MLRAGAVHLLYVTRGDSTPCLSTDDASQAMGTISLASKAVD